MNNAQEAFEKRRAGNTSAWRLPRLMLIGDGFTDSECADRIIVAAEAASSHVFARASDEAASESAPVPERTPGQALWVHLRDRAAPDGLFRECAARLVSRLRNVSPPILLSVNGRPEVAEALRCGYHAGVHDPAPTFASGPRQPCGRSAHNPDEAWTAMGVDHQNRDQGSATGTNHGAIGGNARERDPRYLLFSPVFNPQGKPGYTGAGIDALRDFVHYVQGRLPVYALGGITPERVEPCLDAGSYGVAVLSGIMRADRPGRATAAYLNALRAFLEDPL